MVNPRVYFDVSIGGREAGRLVMELFNDTVPKTAENFLHLCKEQTPGKGYNKCPFHRIIPGFMAQGGDFTNKDGTGGRSKYGAKFNDENFIHKHRGGGILSMANSGPNTNGSQFFLTFVTTQWLDGKHVVFGKVIEDSNNVMKAMERVGSSSGNTSAQVYISGCGEC